MRKKDTERHVKKELPVGTMLNPVPIVLVSCRGKAENTENALAIAWAGTVSSKPPTVSISIRPERHSYNLIAETREFVINLVSEELLPSTDYCGVKSGADENKIKNAGLSTIAMDKLKFAPAIKEAPVSLGCKVKTIIKSGSHNIFVAEIVQVLVDEEYMDVRGKLCLEKSKLVCYSHGDYYAMGDHLGFFGFSVASSSVYKQRMRTPDTRAHKGLLPKATSKQRQSGKAKETGNTVAKKPEKTVRQKR